MNARAARTTVAAVSSTEKPAGTGARRGVQVISRAATILRILSREPAGLTLAEVVARTGLAKSTVYRLLLALQDERLVEGFENRFRIGPILARSAMAETERVRLRMRPLIERLAVHLEETVDLSVLVGDHVMFIDQVRWTRELTAGAVVGGMLPAHACASGKALLAASSYYSDFVLSGPLERETPATVTDPAALSNELEEVRRTKIAVDREGHYRGVCGVATYALASDETAIALGIPVPAVRFEEREEDLRRTLLEIRPRFEAIVSRA
jgi:DNA-binding IclR family transcriptional regulator